MALAWIITRLPNACPIPGTIKADRARQNSAAAEIELTSADLPELDQSSARFQVDPVRYPEHMQQMIIR